MAPQLNPSTQTTQSTQQNLPKAQIGILGGSGFYDLLENAQEVNIKTPYGDPSDSITVGEYKGKKIAFLPRHGRKHKFPPHKIPYQANLYAFKELGVKQVIGPCACGSLQPHVKPGDFVICDQFIDRTRNRPDTFYDGPEVAHISIADPYCEDLRQLAVKTAQELNIDTHDKGTVVIIQGPRFSTKAESRWFSNAGFEVINMTQYPECILARELDMCYLNISLITDYDVGLEGQGDIKPVTIEEVLKIFKDNNEKVKKLILAILEKIDTEKKCQCNSTMEKAFL